MRKLVLGVATLLLPIGLLATVGASGATANASVTGTGTNSCTGLSGSLTFKPALKSGGTAIDRNRPLTFTFDGAALSGFQGGWYGYFSAFWTLAFEVGALAFNFHSGPFSWNGLIVFWMPLTGFGLWILVTSILLLKALKQQLDDKESQPSTPDLVAA